MPKGRSSSSKSSTLRVALERDGELGSWPTARMRPSKIRTSSTTWPRGRPGRPRRWRAAARARPSAGVELADLTTLIELVELLDDLLERRRLDVDHDRDAAEALVVGGRDGQREDVVAPAGEQVGHAGEHAGLVLDQHREGVVRRGGPAGRRVVDSAMSAPPGRGLEVRHLDVVVRHAGRRPSGTPSPRRRCGTRRRPGGRRSRWPCRWRAGSPRATRPGCRRSPWPRPTSRSRAGRATGTPRSSAPRRTSPATGGPCRGRRC